MIGEEFTFFGEDIVETSVFLQLNGHPDIPGSKVQTCDGVKSFGEFKGGSSRAATKVKRIGFIIPGILNRNFGNPFIVVLYSGKAVAILRFAMADHLRICFVNILRYHDRISRFDIAESGMLVKMSPKGIAGATN